VLNNASMIDFAATAGRVREAFHTEMHYFQYSRRQARCGTCAIPQIPAALAPVVAGIKGLSKIPALTNHTKVRQAAYDAEYASLAGRSIAPRQIWLRPPITPAVAITW